MYKVEYTERRFNCCAELIIIIIWITKVPPDLEEGKQSTHDEPDVKVSFCQKNSLKSNVF